jgi:hypothetical protein
VSAAPPLPKPARQWGLALAFLAAALLHAASWAGIGMGAFVLWNSIHAFYFQHSYAAGALPLALAGLLLAAAFCLLLRKARWASFPASAAVILSFLMAPRMGAAGLTEPFVHPMQLVHWGAMALGWAACLWLIAQLFLAARRANLQ